MSLEAQELQMKGPGLLKNYDLKPLKLDKIVLINTFILSQK